VTGISGSGKSTLINNTLVPLLYNKVYKSKASPLNFKTVSGLEFIDKVVEVNQSPIGRTPRSNPATYTGLFGDIRNLFAQLPQAKISGFKAGRFSFNNQGIWKMAESIPEALKNVDAVLILTAWDEFFGLDWNYLASLMRSPAWIFDTRSVVNRQEIENTGINLWKLGEGN